MKKQFTYKTRLLMTVFVLLTVASTTFGQSHFDLRQAEQLVEQGEYARALPIYKQIHAARPTLETTLDLARTYLSLRDYGEAEKLFQSAVADPNCPAEAFLELGDVLMLLARYVEAREVFHNYLYRGGNVAEARIRITASDSARALAQRSPLFTVANERRINTRFAEFGMSAANHDNFFVFTSDRPLNFRANDPDDLAATMASVQEAGQDVTTRLLLRSALDPTNMAAFNTRVADTAQIARSMYEGALYDLTTNRARRRRQQAEERERQRRDLARENREREGVPARPFLNMYVTSIQSNTTTATNGMLGNYVWTAPVMIGPPIGVAEHVGPCAFTPDGNVMYFSYSEPLNETDLGVDGVSRVGIMISHKRGDGTWSDPVPFPHNNRARHSVAHPAITRDGRTIYFASDMRGSYGGMDLWKSELQTDGTWGPPINLGPTINTIRDEVFPTLGPDDRLYFSSNGHPGLGGLDVFRALGPIGEWTGVENLRAPVNSSSDDFSFTYLPGSQNEGIFSSTRVGGYGSDDIYSFKAIPQAPPIVEPSDRPFIAITVLNKRDSTPVNEVRLTLTNMQTQRGEAARTDVLGRALFVITPRVRYEIYAEKENFIPATLPNVSVRTRTGGARNTVLLEPIAVGSSFAIRNINYAVGSAALNRRSQRELDKLVRFLKDNPGVRIELSSHTDATGSVAGNERLSQQRAQGVVTYLRRQGIAANRMVARGYGSTRPIVRNARTPAQHARNRRTEVRILEVNTQQTQTQR